MNKATLLGRTATDKELIGVLDTPPRHSVGPPSLIALSKSINSLTETQEKGRAGAGGFGIGGGGESKEKRESRRRHASLV